MRKSVIESLAKIRLNPTSVEQFLNIACSLADDNPTTIKAQVYEAAKEARSASLLIDHLRNLFGHQQSIDLHHQQQQQQRSSAATRQQQQPDSQFLFTYSNQLTLYKAAKCLVANVAKILFLADSVVLFLSSTQQASSEQQQQQQQRQQYLQLNKHAPGRLDNVANYSQLLRCFGELSVDLVDLGLCIMLGQLSQRNQQQQQQQDDNDGAFLVGTDFEFHRHTDELATTVAAAQRQQQQQPTTTTTDKKLDSGNNTSSNQLENQIHDMQTLFQVNRLIIDRSILLLLSTSKCCLRLPTGSDCLHSLEARRQSILVQIRASISVIMAIVKCSVFSSAASSSLSAPWSPLSCLSSSSSSSSSLPQSQNSTTSPANWTSHFQPTDQWLRTADLHDESLWHSAINNNINSKPLFTSCETKPASSQPLDELEDDYYLRYLAAGASQSAQPERRPQRSSQLADHLNGRQLAPFHATTTTTTFSLNPNPDSKSNKLAKPSARNRRLAAPKRKLEQPLQIMNYFLQTWNGTQSAHDAINNLQSLVKPISQVTSLKSLISVLNGIFAAHFQKKQQQQQQHHQSAANPSQSTSTPVWQRNNMEANATDEDKENHIHLATAAINSGKPSASCYVMKTKHEFMCMEKRLLISTLNSLFLDEIKVNLVERVHEFTDCAYTKHEHREDILMLLQCIRFQLNKLVKILYKCRKKANLGMNDIHLDLLRQVAEHINESCDELKYELQTVVIEQSDELDRSNCQLDLTKQMKHNCLMGDLNRCQQTNGQFNDQSEQLIEICKMLNQIAPTNKMKITTKTLAIWFELNIQQLLETISCLCEQPSSKELKDCTWAYLQAWCSFYDDFCQLARQVAYLTHAQFDSDRSARVAGWRNQVMMRMHQQQTSQLASSIGSNNNNNSHSQTSSDYDLDIDLRATTATGKLISSGGACEPGDSPCGSLELMLLMPDVSREERQFTSRQLIPFQHHHWGQQQHHHHQQQQATGRFCSGASEANQQLRAQSARELELSHASSTEQPLNIMHHRHLRGPNIAAELSLHQTTEAAFAGAASAAASGDCSAAVGGSNDSPRSLDHYYGFGANYHRRAHVHPSEQLQLEPQLQSQLQLHQLHQRGFNRQAHLGSSTSASESHHHHHHQQQQHHHSWQRGYNYHCGPPPLEQQACMSPLPLDDYCANLHLAQPPVLYHPEQQQYPVSVVGTNYDAAATGDESVIRPPVVAPRRTVTIDEQPQLHRELAPLHSARQTTIKREDNREQQRHRRRSSRRQAHDTGQMDSVGPAASQDPSGGIGRASPLADLPEQTTTDAELSEQEQRQVTAIPSDNNSNADQQSANLDADKWSDSDADAIVRGAKETAQMALSMYQFTKGEGDLNTTQDLFTQAELFAEEANELYKEVRCFSYKVPAGDLKKELLNELGTIPALVQQLQFIVKNPTVGKPATFAKVDSVIRETKLLMEAVNRVVTATLSCRQHYNMAIASMRKRTRMLSPSYRADKGFEFENHSSARQSAIGGRHGAGGGGMGSEPDI